MGVVGNTRGTAVPQTAAANFAGMEQPTKSERTLRNKACQSSMGIGSEGSGTLPRNSCPKNSRFFCKAFVHTSASPPPRAATRRPARSARGTHAKQTRLSKPYCFAEGPPLAGGPSH